MKKKPEDTFVRTVPKLCPKFIRNIEKHANITKDIENPKA
jgi:hypothetical protein